MPNWPDKHWLKTRPDADHIFPAADDQIEEQTTPAEEYYLCVQCKGLITSPANEVFVDGAHWHTFANPLGIVFEIGCFKEAAGCSVAGPASDEFAWFQGYRWRIAYCRNCLIHMGWQFIGDQGAGFFGLIKDRMILRKEGE